MFGLDKKETQMGMAVCIINSIFRISKTKVALSNQNTNRSSRRISSLSMDSPPQGYRRNVGICLINSNNKVLLSVPHYFDSIN